MPSFGTRVRVAGEDVHEQGFDAFFCELSLEVNQLPVASNWVKPGFDGLPNA